MTTQLHILFVRTPAGPTPINLSRQYTATLIAESKIVQLKKLGPGPAPSSEHFGVASFHTLYGANGSGKTQLLLDVRQTFSYGSNEKPLGIFFSSNGEEQIYQGQILGGWTVTIEGRPLHRTKRPPDVASVFYTTSPFEFARRNRFIAPNALDVSPSVGHSVSFDGLALLGKYDVLPASIRERARIKVRTSIMTLDQIAEQFISPLRQRNSVDEKRISLTKLRYFIIKWLESLDIETQHFLRVGVARSQTENTNYHWRDHACELFTKYSEVLGTENFPDGDSQAILRHLVIIISSGDEQWETRTRKLSDYCLRLFPKGNKRARGPLTLDSFAEFIGAQSETERSLASSAAKSGILSFTVSNMSSGETAYMVLLASLSGAIKTLEAPSPKPTFFLIDEGEMFMHPEWQRSYISKILGLLRDSQALAEYMHVLITTHSLIVAGDSPPNTLINVDSGEHTNGFGLGPKFILKNVYGVESFAGSLTAELLAKLDRYMSSRNSDVTTDEAAYLAKSLADHDLQEYVKKEIIRRGGSVD
ncbi:AAA family ATPase [Burkholderia lata]|uniref:ATPase AAA-type core domain-containing protein n=1 Tax=Burkholderia lata (strain ATCC 17760 / DSM 23089 / LMG 22485 / NCIMB 9086 / R18194 / 383) TaxID=482957 RepID=A0A6P2XHF6_BURL3|nr:AAA family ATPase [Burkholderia lata]VWD09131.1 hypothetical protein BLA18109_05100 [Burkholderia lata]